MSKRAASGGTPGRKSARLAEQPGYPRDYGAHMCDIVGQRIVKLTAFRPEDAMFVPLDLTIYDRNYGHVALCCKVQVPGLLVPVIVIIDQNPVPHPSVQAMMVYLRSQQQIPLFCYHPDLQVGTANPCQKFVDDLKKRNLLLKPFKTWPIRFRGHYAGIRGVLGSDEYVDDDGRPFDNCLMPEGPEAVEWVEKSKAICYIDWPFGDELNALSLMDFLNLAQ